VCEVAGHYWQASLSRIIFDADVTKRPMEWASSVGPSLTSHRGGVEIDLIAAPARLSQLDLAVLDG
jgi:hypothetical protein